MIATTATRYSKQFYYYTNDEMIGHSLKLYGEYSQREIVFLTSFLNENSVVWDIGANIGYHTTAFASVARRVYAFEPHPKNFALLEKNTAELDNVTRFSYAASSQRGVCYVDDFDTAVVGNFGAVTVSPLPTAIAVPTVDLDSAGIDMPDLIKIDVEGHEWPVIQGCAGIIRLRRPVVYYEAIESQNLREIYEFLEPLGYLFYWAKVDNYNPDNFLGNANDVFGGSALMSILAWPQHYGALDMTPVLGATDAPGRFYRNGHP